MPPVRNALATLLLGAALLSGCGGDDEENDPAPAPASTQSQPADPPQTEASPGEGGPTRAEYIARADAFCKTANARARKLNERARDLARGKTGLKAQLEAIAPVVEEGLKVQRESAEAFKKIEPPPADRAIVEQLHRAADELTDLVAQVGEAAEDGDVARYRQLVGQQARIRTRTRAIQRDYGFKECGSGRNEAG